MGLPVYLAVFAIAWYLLNSMADILRPMLTALLLGYIILPPYWKLRRYFPTLLSMLILLGVTFLVVVAGLKILNSNIEAFRESLTRLETTFNIKFVQFEKYVESNATWLKPVIAEVRDLDLHAKENLQQLIESTLKRATGLLVELFVVFLYLIFMLMEAGKIPDRVRRAFPMENAKRISGTIHEINAKIARYLIAKTLSSFLLALPVWILFQIFGVNLASLWAVITFLGNYVPYVGSAVSISAPSLYILLVLPFGVEPFIVIGLLLVIHLLGASFMEPALLGQAVGLSPVIILFSLTFWGSCWGFGGVILAVPLTVMIKIIMENIPSSAPIAKMLGD